MESPGYPRPDPCLSFWLQGARNSTLIGHRTTEALPERSNIIIIGSGFPNSPESVTLLEAREACDGATARNGSPSDISYRHIRLNGGHCRPDCYRDYKHYKATFGREQALKIVQNEKDTLNLMTEVIEKEGIDCDFWRGFTWDVAMDETLADDLAASYQEFADDGGPVEGIIERILDPEKARRATRCPSATAAYKSPAGSLWPQKLVSHLLKLCVEKHGLQATGLNLQTRTPVREVLPSTDGWRVKTDRGDVQTEKVVYATNAFTATLLPEFLGRIWPFKGQCSVVVPTAPYSGKNMLTETYALSDAEYIIQRQKDGVMIYGGARRSMPVDKLLGNTDDTETYPEMTKALKDALPLHLGGWGPEALGEGMIHAWSGIMGYTTEGVPYVGELHNKPGAFVCAGHHGHGMARIMSCAKGLAAVIQGSSWESTGLPECFQPTPERLSAPSQALLHRMRAQEHPVNDT
ncbi:FAD dependent oxidoreductase-domain-containing protein [Mycena rosella]|uniref:FAD dependent oxidoreductase-domain-containing protein n=1 Tax=Mycena rosella TaxID=1033263 RepID=A0AAD7D4N0_MYCRO|nr:FAD dependent oxidoreductase-domain-containing protein [Mycena rosella]